ncbi:helix-turn-helix transcriptional regulator [Promicromonospora citrea]|uniref:HTH araC/xylS-type domain-containing protein n=1 Tax=Promicromonospora citrea TaxID=43677 RepID=A0A8H9GPU8_9MICO|nr:AraC family transcriptional regulator [Promicromonospora citrea]NNH51745.1 helix-turn-helix transcriptional regulator [Promicromonospora citrea]GGM43914.1 hypothetical protein GCM10010102_44220 [Promicromonospora citrea]
MLTDFLRENLARPLTVADLAAHVGVSPSALTAMFATALGCSPYQYLKRLRLDQAAALLVEGELTIAQVADRVGYTSPSHFASAFREFHGMPPRRYAAAACAVVADRVTAAAPAVGTPAAEDRADGVA